MLTLKALLLLALASGSVQDPDLHGHGTPTDFGPFQALSFDDALAEAGRLKKLVLIDFYEDTCEPCRQMDQSTWRHPEVIAWLEQSTVAMKMQGPHNWRLAQRYDVRGYPTLVFLNPDGTQVARREGYLDDVAFLDFGNYTVHNKSTLQIARERRDAEPENPDLRLVYARKLAAVRDYRAAMQELLWCWDEAGVRTPFLLGELQRLGQRYPSAIEELRKRARAAEASIFGEGGTAAQARDLALLNQYAGDIQLSLATWTRLREEGKDPALSDALFDSVFDHLIAEHRYADVIDGAGDVMTRVDGLIQEYGLTSMALTGDDEPDEELLGYLREDVVKNGAKFYEAALGSGRADLAQQIAARLTSFSTLGSTWSALIEHATRLEAWDAARALRDAGMAALPVDQQFSIRRAAQAIPAAQGSH